MTTGVEGGRQTLQGA